MMTIGFCRFAVRIIDAPQQQLHFNLSDRQTAWGGHEYYEADTPFTLVATRAIVQPGHNTVQGYHAT